jgi:L-ribulokinase
VKLWKHHAAQPEADQINHLARQRQEPWLKFYGGKYSSEWFFSKALQILREAPHIYHAAERLVEAGDWLVWQLTGQESRSVCMAGFKALWQKDLGFPSPDYFAALHPDLGDIIDTKMSRTLAPLGANVGGLCAEAANWTGLLPGTAVAAAMIDAYAAVPAGQATQPGDLLMILGTSTCHMVVGEQRIPAPGICGVVEDGFLPGAFCYEAGQSATGDIFAWFVRNCVPPHDHEAAKHQGVTLFAYLEAEAANQQSGEHGLVALDWWNGCRSPLMNAELSGLIVGATLATTAVDIFRALIEATAFGTRKIIDTFAEGGVPVRRIIAAGGLAEQNKLLLQIYADVTQRDLYVVRSGQAAALGAAMLGAVAAGAHPDLYAAARHMGGLKADVYRPRPYAVRIYDQLYAEYLRLYARFGEEGNALMSRLRMLRSAQR